MNGKVIDGNHDSVKMTPRLWRLSDCFSFEVKLFNDDMEISENMKKGTVFSVDFVEWGKSVKLLLDRSGLEKELISQERILIKPNLVENLKPPITTPVHIISSLIDFLQEKASHCDILIGEGCGSLEYDTWNVFDALGYTKHAKKKNVDLVDLNDQECVRMTDSECTRFPEIFLPKMLFDSFILSVPVLKAHSLAGVTLTMKNMMGAAPPKHYQQGGNWKKASFHSGIQQALYDLNRYRAPDFTLLDATVGMAQAHLWGPTCSPPKNKLAAGFDPVAIDAYGCTLLERDWNTIGHVSMADGVLGQADFKEEKI